jgi:predicted transcriptional regulator
MKKREPILIRMQILESLFASPKGPTRLAQACNVNYGRIAGFIEGLVKKGLVRRDIIEGQETFVITDDGYMVYRDWLEVWRRVSLD